ncbi:MAG: diaminopropionate ammonia-lyase [Eubacteriaceae bacterium]|nr:diaminopropionate ammonia-lyase [Eubacteriaceae bacterium]
MDIKLLINPHKQDSPLPPSFNDENYRAIREFHRSLEEYSPTPLVPLAHMSKRLGIKGLYVKDESQRFGLNAFKALGASWAIHRMITGGKQVSAFVTATDGNHGKAVAWAASKEGKPAYVFMPKGSAENRVKAIQAFGAVVEVTDSSYDGTVAHARSFAEDNGYALVQDTGMEGYTDIPMDITMGYTTMAWEAAENLTERGIIPTHVFLQAGVGSMAGGVMGMLIDYYKENAPMIITVEPFAADCVYQSALTNRSVTVESKESTIMAGLNCGTVSVCTYEMLMNRTDAFISCSDSVAAEGMRILAHPEGSDGRIISGESGAVGAGIVSYLCGRPEYSRFRDELKIDENSVILLFSTEGATDPDNYERIVGEGVL